MNTTDNNVSIVKDGPIGNLINTCNFTEYIIKNINFHYSLKGETYFPGSQPVSIEKKDLFKLNKYEYYVSLKTDGVRFIMVFTKDKQDNNVCILINRAMQIYSINLKGEDKLYSGTILDGELCLDKSKWKFIVHDGLLLCGSKINHNSYTSRLSDIDCVIQSYIYNEQMIDISIKKTYPFTAFNEFLDTEYNNNTLINDGIIFMPNSLPVISGTQYSMFKWKPVNKCTFDFLIKENENNLEAYVFHMKNIVIFAKIHYNTEQGKEFIDKTKILPEYKNECILECSFNNNNFTPLMIRTDKTHCNSLRTVERTLFNINEGITVNDLFNNDI